MGWAEKQLREPFRELLAKGLILYDEKVKLVCIKNHLKHNVIENENQAKAAAKIFASLPKSPLYSHIMEPLAKPFHKPLRELFREQYAEPETKAEIKTEAKEKDILSGKPDDACEVVAYLNQVLGTNYKPTTRKTREIIQARLREGFTVEDFKTVINRKAHKWRGDPKMAEYLRPITLFGTKFESYLNEREAQDAKNQRGNQDARTPAGGVRGEHGKYAGVTKTFDDGS
ncbi:MAG: conserved phage C-terminal domain-containing protein [Deltaproteobacteria bacterium]|nr:conserved phage C-terminal domain-containing protein [Deltaproteobacteria bacterium]